MQPFTSLGHFNLKTVDLDASIAFYAKLGFPEFLRLTQADGRTWIVYLRITDELYIELLPGGIGRAGDQQAAGLNQYEAIKTFHATGKGTVLKRPI
ncbi:MAG: VOC family protein [Hyphomicrobiales bacterium]|nr:MAG: VOC family protein [Hyphomicrobiales bacterium]